MRNPLSHQPIGFSLPDRPKDCGLAWEILQLLGVIPRHPGLAWPRVLPLSTTSTPMGMASYTAPFGMMG